MTLANPPLNKAERAITETIRTSWAPFLVQGSIMMVLGVARGHLAADFDARRRPLRRLDVPVQRTHWPSHHVHSPERVDVSVVLTHRRALVAGRRASALASGRRRCDAHAAASRLLHRRRNLSNRGCDTAS